MLNSTPSSLEKQRAVWSREDIIVAYALYCIIPLNKINPKNKIIRQVAANRGKSAASMAMRMRNFQYIDPNITGEGKKGLSHTAKTDKEIFKEFQNDWGELSYAAETITGFNLFDTVSEKGASKLSSLNNRNKVNRQRAFFRSSVLAAYDNKCCITGVDILTFLRASHIKPFEACRTASERTDPHNGLLLNTFHDVAFDKGLITVTKDYTIRVSESVKKHVENNFIKQQLIDLESASIVKSKIFLPAPEFLEYHNDIIFKGGHL